MSIPFLLDQNPNVASVGLDGERSDPRERFLMALLRRTQSERRRRLALTGGIRLSDGLSQDIANTCARSIVPPVGVRGTGHGRWGVSPALEFQ